MLAIAADGQFGLHPRGVGGQIKGQIDLIDQESRRAIIGEPDRLGGVGAHDIDLGDLGGQCEGVR